MTSPTTQTQPFPKLDSALVDVATGHVSRPWQRFFITLWDRTGGASGGQSVATGTSLVWNGNLGNIPSGFLLEDGSAISRVDWSDLFAIIGVKFGAGDGFSTFNLPNRISRFTYGSTIAGPGGGADQVELTVDNLPAHSHGVTDPGHAHTQRVKNVGADGVAGSRGGNVANDTSIGTTDNSPTGITIDNTGGGTPVPILPPYLTGIPIIKA